MRSPGGERLVGSTKEEKWGDLKNGIRGLKKTSRKRTGKKKSGFRAKKSSQKGRLFPWPKGKTLKKRCPPESPEPGEGPEPEKR